MLKSYILIGFSSSEIYHLSEKDDFFYRRRHTNSNRSSLRLWLMVNILFKSIKATTQRNGLVIEQGKLNQSKTTFDLSNH